jgi:hypothetical protein
VKLLAFAFGIQIKRAVLGIPKASQFFNKTLFEGWFCCHIDTLKRGQPSKKVTLKNDLLLVFPKQPFSFGYQKQLSIMKSCQK